MLLGNGRHVVCSKYKSEKRVYEENFCETVFCTREQAALWIEMGNRLNYEHKHMDLSIFYYRQIHVGNSILKFYIAFIYPFFFSSELS